MPSFFPNRLSFVLAAAVLLPLATSGVLSAQESTAPEPAAIQTTTTQTTGTKTATDGTGRQEQTITNTTTFNRGKKKKQKSDDGGKVVQSKDTKKVEKRVAKTEAQAGADAKLPDKVLYDKALLATKKGHYDVARLDLQTMLNTYPDSQYQMRAKLAIADSWYKEGGTAALTQAESEYADFRVFFPNAPEAAEAQMRIGDIYFRQMDRPDRDYAKAVHAEEEYRRMLTDYPAAPKALVVQAKQRLRDVQEILATRESEIANFYASRENWAATIARYQTVVDTYPLYSHMDDVLVGLGDAYGAQGRYVRTLKLAEGPKARLEKLYDGQAADAYRKVVLEHSAAPHVEDARDRLDAMHLPIPTPTPAQMAESAALENSRSSYTFSRRAVLMFTHTPDTVTSAHIGDPPMVDPAPTVAPTVVKRITGEFNAALNNTPAPAVSSAASVAPATDTSAPSAAPGSAATPAAPLQLNDVANPDGSATTGAAINLATPAGSSVPSSTTGGNGLAVEILTPSARTNTASPAAAGNGLSSVGPKNATPLPAVEAPADSPDRPNEITSTQAAAQQKIDRKRPKVEVDKSSESGSRHKKKKGVAKINPF